MSFPSLQPSGRPPRTARLFFTKLALALGIYAILFLFVELGARIVTGNWTQSFLVRETDLLKTADPAAHDPLLGWVPKPGYSTNSNYWRARMSVTPDGFRSNGPPDVPLTGSRILAIGDSFTFGDEVADHETWPAHLEKILRQPVINGGVFGYGIDQMVLRARLLTPKTEPECVVLSFISDDITRCELSLRGAKKPYFRLVNGSLRLEGQPVPPPQPKTDWFRGVFGHSWVVHVLMRRADTDYWFGGRARTIKVETSKKTLEETPVGTTLLTGNMDPEHEDGEAIASALLRQLADELAAKKIRLLVVVLADKYLLPETRARSETVLAALRAHRVPVLDLLGPLAEMKKTEPERFAAYLPDHMTDLGNRYVAEQIARALRDPATVEGSPTR